MRGRNRPVDRIDDVRSHLMLSPVKLLYCYSEIKAQGRCGLWFVVCGLWFTVSYSLLATNFLYGMVITNARWRLPPFLFFLCLLFLLPERGLDSARGQLGLVWHLLRCYEPGLLIDRSDSAESVVEVDSYYRSREDSDFRPTECNYIRT